MAGGLAAPQGARELMPTWLAPSQFPPWTSFSALSQAQVAQADEHRALWTEWNGMGCEFLELSRQKQPLPTPPLTVDYSCPVLVDGSSS